MLNREIASSDLLFALIAAGVQDFGPRKNPKRKFDYSILHNRQIHATGRKS